MLRSNERRTRTSLFLSGKTNILIDCSPDAASQLSEQGIDRVDAVLITHEHGDHYMGLDELFAYKRNTPHHMSFQRALDFIEGWSPKKETFLVHIGDGNSGIWVNGQQLPGVIRVEYHREKD